MDWGAILGPLFGLFTQGGQNNANQNAADRASGNAIGAVNTSRDQMLQWLQKFWSQWGGPGAIKGPNMQGQTQNIGNMVQSMLGGFLQGGPNAFSGGGQQRPGGGGQPFVGPMRGLGQQFGAGSAPAAPGIGSGVGPPWLRGG